MNSTRPGQTAGMTDRLAWLDVAKGLCILLVVLHHVTSKYVMVVLPPDLAGFGAAWYELNSTLKPMRMPVFFVVSGFFAAGAIHRPWSQISRRMTSPYYLYVVWSLVYVVVYAIETEMAANRTTSVPEFLGELVWASTSAWFLFALAAYFLIAKLARPLPPVLVIGAAVALAAATSWMGIEHVNRVAVLSHLSFFLVGAYFPERVRRWGGTSTAAMAALAAAYVAVFGLSAVAGLPRGITVTAAAVVGVPLGLALAQRIAGRAWLGTVLAWLGRRTLPVYVMHLALLAAVLHLPLTEIRLGPERVLVAPVLPLLVVATLTVACLVLHAVLVRLGATWLFALPDSGDRWSDHLDRPDRYSALDRIGTDYPVWTGHPRMGA